MLAATIRPSTGRYIPLVVALAVAIAASSIWAALTFLEAAPLTSASQATQNLDYGKMPIVFEPNAGQSETDARFISHTQGGTLFFTTSGVVMSVSAGSPASRAPCDRS